MELKEYSILLNKGESLLIVGPRSSGKTHAVKDLLKTASQYYQIDQILYICDTEFGTSQDYGCVVSECRTIDTFFDLYKIRQSDKYRIVIFDNIYDSFNSSTYELFSKIRSAGMTLIVTVQYPVRLDNEQYIFDYICAHRTNSAATKFRFYNKYYFSSLRYHQMEQILSNLSVEKLLAIHVHEKQIFFYKQGRNVIYSSVEEKQVTQSNVQKTIAEMLEDFDKPVETLTIEI
jgi:energy-coupling factor transporter ATP-binding protein EcfA2